MRTTRHLARLLTCGLMAACGLGSCDKARVKLTDLASKVANARDGNSEWVRDISAGEFESFITQNDKLVIIDFHAPRCGPSRKLAPMLEEIATGHKGAVVIGKINVDENPELAASQGVSGIPDLRIYRNGGMVDKLVGLPSADELGQRINTHVGALSEAAPATSQPATSNAGDPPKAIQPMADDWLPPGMERR
jgi:thioredoxin 1